MKPAPTAYLRAGSVQEASEALAEHGAHARILAGGQSLIAMLNMRLAQPKVLVDISRIAALDRIDVDGDHLVVGAGVTQAKLERHPELAAQLPLLAKALPHVGHFEIRNKGTVCGSIAHAHPAGELPLCLAVLNGQAVLTHHDPSRGTMDRTAAGATFFKGAQQTARAPDQWISAVRFPLARPGEGYAFDEMAMRRGDFAIVAVAVKATADGIRIGIAGAADKPHVRDWPALTGSALDDALNALAWEVEFPDDAHGNAKYRRHLVRTLGHRTVMEARACLT